MNIENAIGMVFVKDFASLPGGMCPDFATVALDGWSVIEKLDGYDLTRNIEEAYWHFFSLAGGSSSFAIGPNIESTPSTAINKHGFNSLQITAVTPKNFLGTWYIPVSANSRHVQQSALLKFHASFERMTPTSQKSVEFGTPQAVAQIPSL